MLAQARPRASSPYGLAPAFRGELVAHVDRAGRAQRASGTFTRISAVVVRGQSSARRLCHAELPTLPSTDGIEGLGGSFGSGDGLSRDSESTLERSSSLSSRGTKPLEVQRGLSATGRVPRVASAELEAFVEAGVAPPTHPRRPRVVRFNSVVDDSEPETHPLGS